MQTIAEQLQINKLTGQILAWTKGIEQHRAGLFFGGDMEKNMASIPTLQRKITRAKAKLQKLNGGRGE